MTRYIGRVEAPIALASGGVCTLENLTQSDEIEALAKELIWRPSHLPPRTGYDFPFLHDAISEHDAALGLPTTATLDPLHLATRIAAESIVVRYGGGKGDSHRRSGVKDGVVSSEEEGSLYDPGDEPRTQDEIEARRAYALSHLAALLISQDDADYWGWTFAYPWGVDGAKRSKSYFLDIAMAFQSARWEREGVQSTPGEHPWFNEWTSWQGARAGLLGLSPLLSRASDIGYLDTLEYAGETLDAVGDTRNSKFKLVLLVSIFEMLLTHNPDSRRFNVEDSISRQFLLKTAVLLHRDGEVDLELLKRNLKKLYDLRSAIAHGDFARLAKDLKVGKDRVDSAVSDQVSLAYHYLRRTLRQFLQDPEYVRFLKDN